MLRKLSVYRLWKTTSAKKLVIAITTIDRYIRYESPGRHDVTGGCDQVEQAHRSLLSPTYQRWHLCVVAATTPPIVLRVFAKPCARSAR